MAEKNLPIFYHGQGDFFFFQLLDSVTLVIGKLNQGGRICLNLRVHFQFHPILVQFYNFWDLASFEICMQTVGHKSRIAFCNFIVIGVKYSCNHKGKGSFYSESAMRLSNLGSDKALPYSNYRIQTTWSGKMPDTGISFNYTYNTKVKLLDKKIPDFSLALTRQKRFHFRIYKSDWISVITDTLWFTMITLSSFWVNIYSWEHLFTSLGW